MAADNSRYVLVPKVEVLATTEKALMVAVLPRIPRDPRVWLPKRWVSRPHSLGFCRGATGPLVIPQWLAEEKQLPWVESHAMRELPARTLPPQVSGPRDDAPSFKELAQQTQCCTKCGSPQGATRGWLVNGLCPRCGSLGWAEAKAPGRRTNDQRNAEYAKQQETLDTAHAEALELDKARTKESKRRELEGGPGIAARRFALHEPHYVLDVDLLADSTDEK